jgi:hypothetical protein
VRPDRGDDPNRLFVGNPRPARTGDHDPDRRRRWRIVYLTQLPSPVRSLTLAEIDEQHDRVFDELEQGGAIRVYCNDRRALPGVLTRDRSPRPADRERNNTVTRPAVGD